MKGPVLRLACRSPAMGFGDGLGPLVPDAHGVVSGHSHTLKGTDSEKSFKNLLWFLF